MGGALKHGLANLFNGNGRDARQTFWYYVLGIFILRFVAGLAVSIPLMTHTIGSAVDSATSGATPEAMQAKMMASMADIMPTIAWFGVAVGVITVLLVAASLVRRLHDIGKSGWLVLIPGGLYLYALSQTPAQVDKVMEMMRNLNPETMRNPMAMMGQQGGFALLTWIPAIIVIVIGCIPSNSGPNQYGDAPVRF